MKFNRDDKKLIVISAINLRSGGPLSILHEILTYIDKRLSKSYTVVALVHSKSITPLTKNIEYIEFPQSIKSYLYRFYYEYFYFYKLSKKMDPHLWLSLHDISPRVNATIKAVYCHNPAPFYKVSLKEFLLDKKFALFSWLYRFIYRINIKDNDYIIVQQYWLKKKFIELFKIKNIIVTTPKISNHPPSSNKKRFNNKKVFIYPSFPRVFKNFEVICEAVNILGNNNQFEVLITIDGTENNYSKMIFKKYGNTKNIKFIGLKSKEEIFDIYEKSDCLIFPSKLETCGLPLLEFKTFEKTILASDLPYAHETIGDYDFARFFKPSSPKMLSDLMKAVIENNLTYIKHCSVNEYDNKDNTCSYVFETLLNSENKKNDI